MYKFLLGSALIVGLALPCMAADVVVESRTGGLNHDGYQEPAGRWLDSNTPAETAKSSAPGVTADIGSRKTTVVPNSGAPAEQVLSSARFTPPIPEVGTYHVYLTHPRAANATPLTVYVKHAAGEDRKEILQDGWGATGPGTANTWIEIGSYQFSPDGGQYVELQVTGASGAVDPRNPVQAFADAVRFTTEPLTQDVRQAPAIPGKEATPLSAATPATITAPVTPVPSEPIRWASSLAEARGLASESSKKVFVYFASAGSSRSTDYETRVLKDGRVERAISADYVPVKINMDADRSLSTQLQVFRAGTINIYDGASGAALGQITDTPEAAELVTRLNRF